MSTLDEKEGFGQDSLKMQTRVIRTGRDRALSRARLAWDNYRVDARLTVPTEAAIAVIVLSVPAWQSSGYRLDKFAISLIYISGALGLNVLFGYAGEFSFAPGLVMGIAAYLTGILTVHAGLPLVASMVLATIGGVAASLLLHLSGLRVRGWYFALTSFFALLVFPNVVDLLSHWTGGDEGLSGIPTLRPFASPHGDSLTYEIIAVVVLITIFTFRIILRKRSRVRLTFLSLQHSPRACVAVGLSTVRIKLFAYLVAGVPLGIAGVLLAHLQGSVSYGSFGLTFGIALFAGVILGRPGNFWGPLAGVSAVYVVSLWIGPFSSYNALVLAGAILMVSLLFPHDRITKRHRTSRSLPDPRTGAASFRSADGSARPRTPPGADDVRPPPMSDVPNSTEAQTRLSARGIRKSFGGHVVLQGIDLDVQKGEIVGMLGPNGSGKTTFLNVLSGLVHPDSGEVELDGHSLEGLRPTVISKRGLARTFQIPEIVQPLTVLENIEIATFAGTLFGRRRVDPQLRVLLGVDSSESLREVSRRLCRWLGLESSVLDRRCGELSLGLRRIVEIGRTVAFGATLMCLDEPAAGLNPGDADMVAAALRQFARQSGCSLLVVEHNPGFILGLSDRVVLLEEGAITDEHHAGSEMPPRLQRFLALENTGA